MEQKNNACDPIEQLLWDTIFNHIESDHMSSPDRAGISLLIAVSQRKRHKTLSKLIVDMKELTSDAIYRAIVRVGQKI
jgi:hypothetical protein